MISSGKSRCLVLSLLLCSSLFVTTNSQASSTPDEAFKMSNEPGLGYFGYTSYPYSNVIGHPAALIGMVTSANKVNSISFCNSLSDVSCSQADFFQYASALTFCKNDSEADCIVEVLAKDKNGKSLTVNRVPEFFTDKLNQYEGDSKIGLPPGSSPPLIEIPEAPHQAGAVYMPLVTSYGRYDKTTDKMVTSELGELAIYAVSKTTGKFPVKKISTRPSSYPERNWRASGGDPQERPYTDSAEQCIFNDYTHCVKPHALPLDINFGITVRNSRTVRGWFHGRITEPEIKQERSNNGVITLTVWGKPIQIPGFSTWKKKTELPQDVISYYKAQTRYENPLGGSGSGAGRADLQAGPDDGWSLMRSNNVGFDRNKMEEFLLWLPIVGDKASLAPTVWILKSTTDFSSGLIRDNQCVQDLTALTGIVSTNASQYLAGPPEYDQINNELTYKVASPHLMPNGEEVRGTYDLTMRADLARCLYGVTGTNFKVSISVISQNNQLVEAVTSVIEKNGWFYFSAKGFTFSSPTIKVKFERETPVETSKPAADSSVSGGTVNNVATKAVQSVSKKSITCIKGKATKKITGINPKCPVGYKKK